MTKKIMDVSEQLESLKTKSPPVWLSIVGFLVGITAFLSGIYADQIWLIVLSMFIMFMSLQLKYASSNAKTAIKAIN